MSANKKADQININNNKSKGTPRNKKQPTIQSQNKSLKIGDKITSNGVIKKSISKSDAKIPSNPVSKDESQRNNQLQKQNSKNNDMNYNDTALNFNMNNNNNNDEMDIQRDHNIPTGLSFFNNSINLMQPEFPPMMFFNESNNNIQQGQNQSSDSLSNSSNPARKQRVSIKQSFSHDSLKAQEFQAENKNRQNYNPIQQQQQQQISEKDMSISHLLDDNNNNPYNYQQGINFSFQAYEGEAQQNNQYMQQNFNMKQEQQNIQMSRQNSNKGEQYQFDHNKKQNVLSNSKEQNEQMNQINILPSNNNQAYQQQQRNNNGTNHQTNYNHHHQNNHNNHHNQQGNNHMNQQQNNNHLQVHNQIQPSQVNSITGSHGDKQKCFSLTDQLVVKKNGKYLDDYQNVQNDSNSQKDGKRLIMLGRGGFGQVFLIKQRAGNREERAMKVIMKQYEESLREVMILKKFSHPNVLKIYEYFEDEQNIYVITERCYGYNLFDYIILKGQFTEQETCKIADGILRALAEAHKQNIVHRDVKPENIMLDYSDNRESFIVKLIDWGLAEQIQDQNKYLTKRCGTLHYLAPEVLAKKYNEKVDLWSLGMVLYTLIQGSPPICGKSQMDILEQINEFRVDFKYFCWKNISDEGKDLILKLLERDFNKRISASDALKHPWFSKFISQIDINTQDLRSSYNSLVKYTQQNAFKKTVLGFFASHVISKRERAKYVDIFQALDIDKNGELSIDELKSGFSKIFDEQEFGFCQDQIEHIFLSSLSSKFENAQGIKYEEFLSSMLACSATYSKEQLYEAFYLFDKDKNGKITLSEIIDTLGIQQQNELITCFKDIIEEFDSNQDGEIDFEEFSLIMTNFLDKHSQDILSQDIYLQ